MIELKFRNLTPRRTYEVKHNYYQHYKEALRKDFNQRCGYTDCPDFYFGGSRTFHIDHFLPKKKYPLLECEYANLVYSCSYVNMLKSDNDDGNFLDPCDVDFNQHFYRTRDGSIKPKSTSNKAIYMYKKLKLFSARYSIIWIIEQLREKLDELQVIRKSYSKEKKNCSELLELIAELSDELNSYLKYLEKNQ